MTITTNSRLAGAAYILYVVAGIASTVVARESSAWSLLILVTVFCALVLGVTLWALTRAQDPDLAMLAMGCRVLEAAPGSGEIFFAVGSAIFCWLLLQGRMIPVGLAWLGTIASVFLVLLLPLQTAGFFGGPGSWSSPVTWAIWLPMLVFELSFAAWLLTRGVSPARAQTA